MHSLLSDTSKFNLVQNKTISSIIFAIELKINTLLRKLKATKTIAEDTYKSLFASGSNLGLLYGLPKIHKLNVPLRPILSAVNLANHALAKFLVPLLSNLTKNEFSLTNSFNFAHEIKSQNSNHFMVSFDVESLFTNVPLFETVDLIIQQLFPSPNSKFLNFSLNDFRSLLLLAVSDYYFIFDSKIYKQIEGISMGCALGPTFADIFMISLEKIIFTTCPEEFRPVFYRRYVDDTFALFRDPSHAPRFLEFINNLHNNINFTMETESDNKLPFLDVLVTRNNSMFCTSVFRKETFTGLGMNFYSSCIKKFKLNSINTLLYRAYEVCSTFQSLHIEFEFLRDYLLKKKFPNFCIDKHISRFLDSKYHPKENLPTVPKEIKYVSLPFLGPLHSSFHSQLIKILKSFFPATEFRLCYVNPLTIGSLFRSKDTLPSDLRSSVVYEFTCPGCKSGSSYIGSTSRQLMVRVAEHRGISPRTFDPISNPVNSAIRNHTSTCKKLSRIKNNKDKFSSKDFKILATAYDLQSLHILESLLIRKNRPNINNDSGPIQLFLT